MDYLRMRNLVEYPLTVEEVLNEIKELYDEENKSQKENGFKMGDMRLMILAILHNFVATNSNRLDLSIGQKIIHQ